MARDVKLNVFVSSKMQEFAEERRILHKIIPELLSGIVSLHGWVFEYDAPASEDTSQHVWLPQLTESIIYIGLLGKEYGEWTIDEFNTAAMHRIPRLIFIKRVLQLDREQKLDEFIDAISGVPTAGLTPQYFDNTEDLKQHVEAAICNWILKRLSKKSRRELLETLNQCHQDYLAWFDANQRLSEEDKDESEHRKIIRRAIEVCEDAEDLLDDGCKSCLDVKANDSDWDHCYSLYKNYLTYIARKRFVPYFVTGNGEGEGPEDKAGARKMGVYYQRNLDAFADAIDRLKVILDQY